YRRTHDRVGSALFTLLPGQRALSHNHGLPTFSADSARRDCRNDAGGFGTRARVLQLPLVRICTAIRSAALAAQLPSISSSCDDSRKAKAENLRGYSRMAFESCTAAHDLAGGRGLTLGRPFDPGTSEPAHRASFSFETVRCIDLPARIPPTLALSAERE